MAFKAKFKFKGKEYDLLGYDFDLNRDVDSKGKPSSSVYGGKITLEVESKEDTTLLQQAVDKFKKESGTITVIDSNSESTLKECKFEKGFFCEFEEKSSSGGNTPMSIRVVISAQKITYGSATHENKWPDGE